MKKYLYLYSGGRNPQDPSKSKEMMQAWIVYYEKIHASLLDVGAPFAPGGILRGACRASGATGFTFVHADTFAEAVALTEGHPHLANGGGIEIFECLDLTL